MRKYFFYLIVIFLFIVTLFIQNFAYSQSDPAKDYFESINIVGNTAYIGLMPAPNHTQTSSTVDAEPQLPQQVLRAVNITTPSNPVFINDIDIPIGIGNPYYSGESQMLQYGEYIYSVIGENAYGYSEYGSPYKDYGYSGYGIAYSGYGYAPGGSSSSSGASFSISKIENNQTIVNIKTISLSDILNKLRQNIANTSNLYGTSNQYYMSPSISINEHYAYIIFNEYSAMLDNYNYDPYYSSPTLTPEEEGIAIVCIDITNPNSPSILGATRLKKELEGAFGSEVDLAVQGQIGYLYIASYNYNASQIQVLDLSSPNNISKITTFNVYGQGGKLVIDGNNLFVASDNFGLLIINISNPYSPQLIGWYEPTNPYYSGMRNNRHMIINGKYVYLLDSQEGLLVLDIKDPTHPTLISKYNAGSSSDFGYSPFLSMDIYNNYLFLLGSGYIDIVSLVNPYNLLSVGIFGEKEPGALIITLRIEAVDLLNIQNGEMYSDGIARFGIPSLDLLNKKYGVFEIYPMNQYYPPTLTGSIEDIENYTPTIEEMKSNRSLRQYLLKFPESVDAKEMRDEYKQNAYVILAEINGAFYGGVYGGYGYASSLGGYASSTYAEPSNPTVPPVTTVSPVDYTQTEPLRYPQTTSDASNFNGLGSFPNINLTYPVSTNTYPTYNTANSAISPTSIYPNNNLIYPNYTPNSINPVNAPNYPGGSISFPGNYPVNYPAAQIQSVNNQIPIQPAQIPIQSPPFQNPISPISAIPQFSLQSPLGSINYDFTNPFSSLGFNTLSPFGINSLNSNPFGLLSNDPLGINAGLNYNNPFVSTGLSNFPTGNLLLNRLF